MDPHAVKRWITLGLLDAERRGSARTEKQGGDTYIIWQADVKRFVCAHPEEVDFCKVDKLWLLDLVTDGRVAG